MTRAATPPRPPRSFPKKVATISRPTSMDMAEGFFSRRFSNFIDAARQQDPRWILLGDDPEAFRYEQEPWRSREHRGWMCLLVAAATGELKPLPPRQA